jgi:hypothetical protein
MLPAMILSYFVALSAALLLITAGLGPVGIVVALAFVFWVERELYQLSKIVEKGPSRGES